MSAHLNSLPLTDLTTEHQQAYIDEILSLIRQGKTSFADYEPAVNILSTIYCLSQLNSDDNLFALGLLRWLIQKRPYLEAAINQTVSDVQQQLTPLPVPTIGYARRG